MAKEERKQRDVLIVEKYQDGVSAEILAFEHGLSRNTIWRVLRTNKARPSMRMTKSEYNKRDLELSLSFISGISISELSEIHKMSESRVYGILASQHVDASKQREARHLAVKELLNQGKTKKEISESMEMPLTTVQQLACKLGHPWDPKELDCQICSKIFIQKSPNQVCCSDCTDKNSVYHNKKRIWVPCEVCGKRRNISKGKRSVLKRCRTCAIKARNKSREIRNDEIWYLREVQNLTFVRIGEIFNIDRSVARRHYIKQRRNRNLAALDAT